MIVRPFLLAILVTVVATGAAPAPAVSQGSASPPGPEAARGWHSGTLGCGAWRLSVWGHVWRGAGCWLPGPDQALRLEILMAASGSSGAHARYPVPHLADLLLREGEGWTVASPGQGLLLLQPWGEGWRALGGELSTGLRVLAAALTGGPDGLPPSGLAGVRRLPARRRPLPLVPWLRSASRAQQGTTVRLELLPAEPAPPEIGASRVESPRGPRSWRSRMERRGTGRGGAGEILRLHWPDGEGPPRGRALEATSSRRPGRLVIRPGPQLVVHYPYPEAFLPLWTLAELLKGLPRDAAELGLPDIGGQGSSSSPGP
jgi:hypothetical protein